MFRSGIYIGWVGFNNLGDEAIYEQCRRRFADIHWSPFLTVDYSVQPGQFIRRSSRDLKRVAGVIADEIASRRRLRSLGANVRLRLAAVLDRQVAVCGGDIYLNRNVAALEAYRKVRKQTGTPVPVFGTGVLHPDFWTGRENGWVDKRKEWVDLLGELPVVGVRGPLSKAYLEEVGARNVVVCGDPAVSYHSRYANRELRTRQDGPLRIGINAGFYPGTWGNVEKVQASLVALARWLQKEGHQTEIVPAWGRDYERCVTVANAACLGQSAVVPMCSSPGDFLTKIEKFDLFVALNMHSGVLAAAANVPFVSLEYHPKCRDFASTLNWEDYLIRTDQLTAEVLIDRVSVLMARLPSERKELCRRMCMLVRTFEGYCKDIEPLLLGEK